MRNFSRVLLVMFLATSAASAHEDRILTLTPDGSIPEIPATFGKAHLTVEGLGTQNPLFQFKVGAHQITLPACVTRFIRTKSEKDIQLTGSWYHDESQLPYYINVEFYDPGYSPKRHANSSYRILFNLRNAKFIELTRFKSNLLGNGGQFTDIELSASCKLALTGMWSNNSFKPSQNRGSAYVPTLR